MKLGVAWKRKTKEGKEYLSGVIDIFPYGQISVALFKNEYKKEGTSQPDYNISYTPISEETPKKEENIPF